MVLHHLDLELTDSMDLKRSEDMQEWVLVLQVQPLPRHPRQRLPLAQGRAEHCEACNGALQRVS